MRRHWKLLSVVLVAAVVATACNYAYVPFIARVDGPVVMTAGELGIGNFNLDPDRGVAYRWDADAADWVQIPVQVDERVVVDFGATPGNNNTAGTTGTIYGSGTDIGVTVLTYADPNTWVGADSDATLDSDDEIVFLSRDAGEQAPNGTAPPAGTVGGVGREVELVDPDGGTPGYVYFFYGTAGVDPSAGEDHVTYDFVLDAGNYKDDYLRADGPNPESSTVVTDNYSMGFSDRWFTVDLSSNWGTGVDILDGHKSQFAYSTCGRSNATFANAHGAFIANIDGPVRGIRAYIGANSGPITQRTEYFYEDRYEQVTDLRVHAIPSIMSFWDWNSSASGLVFSSSELASPVTIDGVQDTVSTSVASWESLEGPQADITIATEFESSFATTTVQLHADYITPPFTECWGDGSVYGGHGQSVSSSLPNTDPRTGGTATFQSRSVLSVWPEATDLAAWAPVWAAEALQDLDRTVTNF
ncbi:MAG: hypothetical protein AAF548_18695 [Actinomycetota bacterium]